MECPTSLHMHRESTDSLIYIGYLYLMGTYTPEFMICTYRSITPDLILTLQYYEALFNSSLAESTDSPRYLTLPTGVSSE